MQGLTLAVTLLVATAAGSGLTAGAFLLGGRGAARPARVTERRLDRAWQTLEADRARLLNLLLAKDPASLALLQSSSPAQPPAPDQSLGLPPELTTELGPSYAADPYELDTLDDAALDLARR